MVQCVNKAMSELKQKIDSEFQLSVEDTLIKTAANGLRLFASVLKPPLSLHDKCSEKNQTQ